MGDPDTDFIYEGFRLLHDSFRNAVEMKKTRLEIQAQMEDRAQRAEVPEIAKQMQTMLDANNPNAKAMAKELELEYFENFKAIHKAKTPEEKDKLMLASEELKVSMRSLKAMTIPSDMEAVSRMLGQHANNRHAVGALTVFGERIGAEVNAIDESIKADREDAESTAELEFKGAQTEEASAGAALKQRGAELAGFEAQTQRKSAETAERGAAIEERRASTEERRAEFAERQFATEEEGVSQGKASKVLEEYALEEKPLRQIMEEHNLSAAERERVVRMKPKNSNYSESDQKAINLLSRKIETALDEGNKSAAEALGTQLEAKLKKSEEAFQEKLDAEEYRIRKGWIRSMVRSASQSTTGKGAVAGVAAGAAVGGIPGAVVGGGLGAALGLLSKDLEADKARGADDEEAGEE